MTSILCMAMNAGTLQQQEPAQMEQCCKVPDYCARHYRLSRKANKMVSALFFHHTLCKLTEKQHHLFFEKCRYFWKHSRIQPVQICTVFASVQPHVSIQYRDDENGMDAFVDLDILCHFGINSTAGRAQSGNRWFMTCFELVVFRFDPRLVHVTHSPSDEEKTIGIELTENNKWSLAATASQSSPGITGLFEHSNTQLHKFEYKSFQTTYEYWVDVGPNIMNKYDEIISIPKSCGMNRWLVELDRYYKRRKPVPGKKHTDDYAKLSWKHIPPGALAHKSKTFKITYRTASRPTGKTRFALLLRNTGRKCSSPLAYELSRWIELEYSWNRNGTCRTNVLCDKNWLRHEKDVHQVDYVGELYQPE